MSDNKMRETRVWYQGTFPDGHSNPWEHAYEGFVYAKEILEAGKRFSARGKAEGESKAATNPHGLESVVLTVDKVRNVIDQHLAYAKAGVHLGEVTSIKEIMEKDGEADAAKDLADIKKEAATRMAKTSNLSKQRAKSIRLKEEAKQKLAENERSMNQDYNRMQQNSDIRNYYHSVEIAGARIDAVLSKVRACNSQ